jgi:hypothetical protein
VTSPRLGLDRNLRLAWLDTAAAVAARHLSTTDTQAALMAALEGQVPGTTPQSGRGKTVTVLRRIWFNVPASAEGLRDRALTLLAEGDADDRLALHWGMLLATHPFFVDVVAVIGRLLTIQGTFERVHVLRRLAERWGDKSTIARAVPRILSSQLEWGVLRLRGEEFIGPGKKRVVLPSHAALLAEAVVLSSPGHTTSLQSLMGAPTLFPFDVSSATEWLRRSEQFRIHREGLDVEMLTLTTLQKR